MCGEVAGIPLPDNPRYASWIAGCGGLRAFVGKDSRDIIRELEADGWYFVGATGSHHHFKHPSKPGKVTRPHPRKDLHPKTLRSIYKQAQIQQKR